MNFNNLKTYPAQQNLEGEAVLFLLRGVEEFKKEHGDKYDLKKYEILLNKFESEKCYAVTFLPNIESQFDDILFEIPNKGIYTNGPGITYFFSLENYLLLSKRGMR